MYVKCVCRYSVCVIHDSGGMFTSIPQHTCNGTWPIVISL